MYYLIDFTVHDEGLFTVIQESKGNRLLFKKLNDNRIIVTDQELEGYTILIPRSFSEDYGVEYRVPPVIGGTLSIYPIQKHWHNVLIGGCWEVSARYVAMHENCFELRVNTADSLFVTTFKLGEPDDPMNRL